MNEFLQTVLTFLVCVGITGIVFFFILGSASLCADRIIQDRPEIDKGQCFSTSKYLEVIEKAHLSILEEQENREPYIITLWWGLDGVRLNDAGEVEWISRRKKPKANYSYDEVSNTACFHHPWLTYPTIQQNCMTQSIDAGIQQMTGNINSSIQSQILQLQFQAVQMKQNARLLESLSTARDIYGRVIRQ